VKAKVRIRYPEILRERAVKLAKVFNHPDIMVELAEDDIDEIVIEGPNFATADLTRATALLRRYLLALEKRNGKSSRAVET
jgi:hypothetical protein